MSREDERSFGDRPDTQRRAGPVGGNAQSSGGQFSGNRDQMPIRYPDNQQIFVGNLPYDIMESDLRDHFSGNFSCYRKRRLLKIV